MKKTSMTMKKYCWGGERTRCWGGVPHAWPRGLEPRPCGLEREALSVGAGTWGAVGHQDPQM